MISTEQALAGHGRPSRVSTESEAGAPRCRCGQELDVCSGSHCPRCGADVPAHH